MLDSQRSTASARQPAPLIPPMSDISSALRFAEALGSRKVATRDTMADAGFPIRLKRTPNSKDTIETIDDMDAKHDVDAKHDEDAQRADQGEWCGVPLGRS